MDMVSTGADPSVAFAPNGRLRSKGASLALLAFAQLIISLDINIVFVALPEIGRGLHFSQQTLQWVVSAYTVFCGGFLLFGGRAADLLGQRRMFVFALFLYAASSLAGGLAWSPAVIVGARAIQGIGGAFLFPATLSLINRLFAEGAERNRALAIWGGAGASGLTLGSLAGGVLTNAFGWPSVFYVNVILAVLAACAAFLVIPRDTVRPQHRRFDFPGALAVTAGATSLVYSLVQGPADGWQASNIVAALVFALVALAIFVLIEARSSEPLMPLRLFGNGSLVAAMSITFIYMGTFGALPYFITDFLQNILHFSALQTGLGFLVPSLSIAAGTQLGERLATKTTTRVTLQIGFVVGIVGTLLLVPATFGRSSYTALLPGLVISGVGQGITWTGMWIAAASGVEHDDQGVASGMASTMLNLGNGLGLAVLVAIASIGARSAQHIELQSRSVSGTEQAFIYASAGMLIGLITANLIRRPQAA